MINCNGPEVKISGNLYDITSEIGSIIFAFYEHAEKSGEKYDPDSIENLKKAMDENIIMLLCIAGMDDIHPYNNGFQKNHETFHEAISTVRESIEYIRKMG